jgi:LysM repeat protein
MARLALVPRTEIPLGGRILRRGDVGKDVHELQFLLHKVGLYKGPLDGNLGILTEDSIIKLQSTLGLTIDGMAGSEVIRVLTEATSIIGWQIHKVKSGDKLRNIASTYGIHPSAIRSPEGNKTNLQSGQVLYIPERKLWLWDDEYNKETRCSGTLVQDGIGDQSGINEFELPRIKVIPGPIKISQKERGKNCFGDEAIFDYRGSSLQSIRKIIRLCRCVRGMIWIWVNDEIFEHEGIITYLNLCGKSPGLIIHLNPPMGKGSVKWRSIRSKRLHRTPNPVFYSLDITPVLENKGKHQRISTKEVRSILSVSNVTMTRVAPFAWGCWELEQTNERLWIPDRVTITEVFKKVISHQKVGVILEGINPLNSRYLKIHREFFAIVGSPLQTREKSFPENK